MKDTPRLIEHAFPLKQASLDSVHEKNVRHGHISTLHIWPARRPLAAARAALIATLLPDPGTPEERAELCEKIGGKIVGSVERKKMPDGRWVEREREATEGGILHWGRESENRETLEWFKAEIRKAYGGRAPRVLDPFAGGGAIPLEAMRLGCEVTAVDINPVAWFILKCTLDYPQRLAGKSYPLPDFILDDEEFMESFYKAHPQLVGKTRPTKKQLNEQRDELFKLHREDNGRAPEADLAWHVRAWGRWVLDHARRELAQYYPTYADFEPLDRKNGKPYERRQMRLVPLKEDGTADIDRLNADFTKEYLSDQRNPRWIAKPTVAYLWARTAACKNCRATIPLLKTRWLCKKDRKRVLLTMEPNQDKSGVLFGIENDVPPKGGNAAQRREHDRRIGAGTMSRSGAKCPCCGAIMTMEDLRHEGQAGRIKEVMTAVVVDGVKGKEYREPTDHEREVAEKAAEALPAVFAEIPYGIPNEPLPSKEALGFRVPLYGLDQWHKLFTPRQLVAVASFLTSTRNAVELLRRDTPDLIWTEAIGSYLAAMVDRLANQNSTGTMWNVIGEKIEQTFARFALPIHWDYPETALLSNMTGGYTSALQWVALVSEDLLVTTKGAPSPQAVAGSSIATTFPKVDIVVTDPPYYDAIPYSDLMDFFYIWLRRTAYDLTPQHGQFFSQPLGPKWDSSLSDGELIDDSSRHGGDSEKSKKAYENGMYRSFVACRESLETDGRLVIVFANKQPAAWETLVSAIVQAGFLVDGSWPIATELRGGVRNFGRASLSSSVWLVCKKRPEDARAGWDNQVLEEMRHNIGRRLREFWDAGIRGPDFVWAATGPALEAYSKHPVVKKANEPGVMTVGEFLAHVRRIVVDFVVGRVLSGGADAGEEEGIVTDRLDQPTAYYLLHRHDFQFGEAPAGACILYALSCGLSDKELASTWDLVTFTGGSAEPEEESGETGEESDEAAEDEGESRSGNKVRLKSWSKRLGRSLGYEAPAGRAVPLIDRAHRLMHLWKEGELQKVEEYLDENGLRRHELFKRLLQALIELSPSGSEERALLESVSNHLQARGPRAVEKQLRLENDPVAE